MKKIKIKFYKSIHISNDGYMHLPILYIAYGKNGFVFSFLIISICVAWNN